MFAFKMSMFVFKTVVLVFVLGLQMLMAKTYCGFPDTKLPTPASCTATWKADEADTLIPDEPFDECTFKKQHIIATLYNGLDWEIWENPNETGGHVYDLGSATFYGGYIGGKPQGAYYAKWDNSGDFISRAGLQFEKFNAATGKMRKGCTYTKYGLMTAQYSFTKIQWDGLTDIAGSYSYVGIYGWARNPLVEFYIIDDWFGKSEFSPLINPVPPSTVCNDVEGHLCKIGEYEMDGGKYVLYSKTRGPAYSINGPNKCFTQIYAVRTTTRQCGTIQIDKHFAEWAKPPYCLVLNEMYEAKILVESGGGTGWIEFTHLTVTKEYDCNEGEEFNVGTYPSDTYSCPDPASMPPPPNNQIKYEACPVTPGGGAEKLWNKKALVGMVVLWVVFLLFQ